MTNRDVRHDALDPAQELENHVQRLVNEARTAGVPDDQIVSILDTEAREVENDTPTAALFD